MPPQSRQERWVERIADAKRAFPATDGLDWDRKFRDDPGLMAAVMHDILKADAYDAAVSSGASWTGRPAMLEANRDTEMRLRQFQGEDHTTLEFSEAFSVMVGQLRLSTVAHKVGISKTQVWRLLRAQVTPSPAEMEKIAVAFRRHPSYFAEWRAGWVLSLLARRLDGAPEATIGFYKRLSPEHP